MTRLHAMHDHHAEPGSPSGALRFLMLAALALSVLGLTFSVSLAQLTRERVARNVLESGIAFATDLDEVIASNRDALRQLAEAKPDGTVQIPDYPLDVTLTRVEVTVLPDSQLRSLILERSSALVYEGGLAAFDSSGQQSVGFLSTQGVLEQAVSQMSRSAHSRAVTFSLFWLALVAVFSVVAVLTTQGWARLRGLGLAVVAGAIPGFTFALLASWLAGQLGGAQGFGAELAGVVQTALAGPVRNFGAVLGLGLLLIGASAAFAALDRRSAASQFIAD